MSNRERAFEIDDPTPDQPGWTVARPITSCFQFHRQLPGSERIGGVTVLIEPRPESRSILFVDNLADDLDFESVWINEVVTTVSLVAVKGLQGKKPVVGLKITLNGLYVHPIDSRSSAFRYSTERALLDGFEAVGLVEWSTSSGE